MARTSSEPIYPAPHSSADSQYAALGLPFPPSNYQSTSYAPSKLIQQRQCRPSCRQNKEVSPPCSRCRWTQVRGSVAHVKRFTPPFGGILALVIFPLPLSITFHYLSFHPLLRFQISDCYSQLFMYQSDSLHFCIQYTLNLRIRSKSLYTILIFHQLHELSHIGCQLYTAILRSSPRCSPS